MHPLPVNILLSQLTHVYLSTLWQFFASSELHAPVGMHEKTTSKQAHNKLEHIVNMSPTFRHTSAALCRHIYGISTAKSSMKPKLEYMKCILLQTTGNSREKIIIEQTETGNEKKNQIILPNKLSANFQSIIARQINKHLYIPHQEKF